MWELDYDGALLLRIPAADFDAWASGSFYKLSIKRYVREATAGFVRFRPSLTYLDYSGSSTCAGGRRQGDRSICR